MAVICVPLRAAGETLGLVIQIGRRWCLGVVLLHESAVLFVCGVLGSGFRDVGCHVRLVWAAYMVASLAVCCVCVWVEHSMSMLRAPCLRLLRSCHVLYYHLYSLLLLLSMQ